MKTRAARLEVRNLTVLSAARAILTASDVPSCRAAIGRAATGLGQETGCPVRACEISVSLHGVISIAWQGGDSQGPPFDDQGGFGVWFVRALSQLGKLTAIYGSAAGLVAMAGADELPLYVGLIADCAPEAVDGLADAMNDLAGVAAQQLYRLHKDAERRQSRSRLDWIGGLQAELLRANVDLIWEADGEGIVHVVQVFNQRHDLVGRIEGRKPEDIRVAGHRSVMDLIFAGGCRRNIRLEQTGEETLYISVAPVTDPGERLRGTLSAGPDFAADRLAADALVLKSVLDARTREELSRREAESMLLGLRILLAPAPFREKLEKLAHCLACTADCEMVQIIQLRPGEAPRLLSPRSLLSSQSAEALRRVLALGEGCNVTVLPVATEDCAVIRAILAADMGDIALVTLPYAAERFYLVCRGRPSFGLREQGVMERFSLLLQQALVLHEDQERLVHAEKLSALGQMSVSLVHELRQPLNTISIAAQNVSMLMERNAVTPELLKEKVERILKQVERACKVMDRMRRFGRRTSGELKPVPLVEVARSARSLMHAVAESSGIVIDVDIPEGAVALTDELEMEQVLVNLLQNARDAIVGAGARRSSWVRIWSSSDRDDPDVIRLHVQDNGPGFAPEILNHALDAFFTTKAGDKGTGLGLSISNVILREHGGRLHIANAAEGGGLITLFLRRPEVARIIPIAPQPGTP